MSRTSRELHRRPRRRTPAIVTAVALLVVGVLVGWAAGQRLLTGSWPGFAQRGWTLLERSSWLSPLGWGLAATLLVLGLSLGLAAVVPGRFRSIELAGTTSPQVRAGAAYLSRGGLARLAAAHLSDLDGVDHVTVSATGRRLHATIRTSLTDTSGLRSAAREALAHRFTDVGTTPLPKVRVTAVRRGARS